jgi:hypothetical protein
MSMRLRERSQSIDVADLWLLTVTAEFGSGRQAAALRRMVPLVRQLLDGRRDAEDVLIEMGRQFGHEGCDLGFALRSLEMLFAAREDGSTRSVGVSDLRTRAAALAMCNGWNTGVIERSRPSDPLLTPMPIFMRLLQQRYMRGDVLHEPDTRFVVVVIDIQLLSQKPLALLRVRSGLVGHLRDVFFDGQPLAEGSNGNLLAMVQRDPDLQFHVADLRGRIASDPHLGDLALHTWVEPLADAEIHLASHIESLAGPID